jgi:hypothetical protein
MKKHKVKSKRTTLNLDVILIDRAHEVMRDEGYGNNFSAFVAELVRQKWSRTQREKRKTEN